MNDDSELLRRYVEDRSESDFSELVRRYVGLVYSCALRRVGHDTHLAEDVAQMVFCTLARKARSLINHPALSGWLFVTTHLAAAEVVRQERRRKARELQATTMEEILHPNNADPEPDWNRLRPLLDDLIFELKDADREMVALRFFEKRSFAEVGRTLRLTEDAARKRVERAVEKLRTKLAERGVTSSTAALAFTLSGQAAASVPAALAAKVAGTALAEMAATGSGSTLIASLISVLTSDITAVVATLVAAMGIVAWQHHANAQLQSELAGLGGAGTEIRALARENVKLARQIAEAEDLRRTLAKAPSPQAAITAPAVVPTVASVTIRVTKKGTLFWENEPVALEEFINRLATLRALHPDEAARVVIRADPGAGFGAASYAVEQASRAGIKHIAIDTQATPGPVDSWIMPPAPPGPKELLPPSIPDPSVNP